MRALTELLGVVDLLGRIVQEAQVDVGLVSEERREEAGRHVEGASQHRQHALAQGLHRLEVADHGRAHPLAAGRPLVGAAQRRAGHDVGMIGARARG